MYNYHKKILGTIAILIIIVSSKAGAIWSAPAKVNKGNEADYGIKTTTSILQDQQYVFQIEAPMVSPLSTFGKHCWLIMCKSQLQPEQQNFRYYVWGVDQVLSDPNTENCDTFGLETDPNCANILCQVPMAPNDKELIQFTLHKEIIDQSYVYIDFPHFVLDGGYYYTIDLFSYIEEPNEQSQDLSE